MCEQQIFILSSSCKHKHLLCLSAGLGLAAGALKASDSSSVSFQKRNDGEEDGQSVRYQKNNDAGQPGAELVSGHISAQLSCRQLHTHSSHCRVCRSLHVGESEESWTWAWCSLWDALPLPQLLSDQVFSLPLLFAFVTEFQSNSPTSYMRCCGSRQTTLLQSVLNHLKPVHRLEMLSTPMMRCLAHGPNICPGSSLGSLICSSSFQIISERM